jgi:hypothetical protein
MQDAIQRFISAADNFLSRYGIYKFHGGPANFATEPQKGSVALALLIGPMQPSLCQVRCQLEKTGEGLPALLVRNGHDSRALLRFCNAIREADFETAIPLWPAIKAELQQVAIVAGLPPQPAAPASNSDGPQTEGTAKGVSMLDAALILTEEDRELSKEKKNAWLKLRTPKLPASIGKCPNHRQVKLFAPSAISDFVEAVEGKPLCAQYKLRQRLIDKARTPRSE